MHSRRFVPLAAALAICATVAFAQSPRREVVAALESYIQAQMLGKQLPSMAIVLVEDRRVVWSRGFGGITAETILRTGSVSKLFTDIAIMQLVEQGKLNLDLPVGRYLPDFKPVNRFGKPITLRHLMTHRSGLVREPPVGNYFDTARPMLDQTVLSLNDTELLFEPGTRSKYSNAAVSVAGLVLERTQRMPFAQYMREHVLAPLMMNDSAYEPDPRLTGAVPKAQMWTYDGRQFEAPQFALGTVPAGGLDASILDLGQFLKMLVARGQAPGGRVLGHETLNQMWQPQFGDEEQGLGFQISKVGGERAVGHGGAIYGFATELEAIPDANLGVAVITTRDCANAVVTDIAHHALEWMLDARAGRALRPAPQTYRTCECYDRARRGGRVSHSRRCPGCRIQG